MLLIDGETRARCIMAKSFKLRKVDSCASARGWMLAARRLALGVTGELKCEADAAAAPHAG
jgi:hypothetical protein